MQASAATVGATVESRPGLTYGINTGFGAFANRVIPAAQRPASCSSTCPQPCVRRGRTAARPRSCAACCCSRPTASRPASPARARWSSTRCSRCSMPTCCRSIPAQGSVGASGDLAPLAHLGAGARSARAKRRPTARLEAGARSIGLEVLRAAGLEPLELQAKEGLALLNGTQLSLCAGPRGPVPGRAPARRLDRRWRTDGRRPGRQPRAVRRSHPAGEPPAGPGRRSRGACARC